MLQPLFACILGVTAHYLVFIHGDWHLWVRTIVYGHIIAMSMLVIFDIELSYSIKNGLTDAIITSSCYFISLFSSIVVYRIYFHRLRPFPGPKLAAASKLWHVWQCRDSRNHLLLESLYQKYGAFVRTGRTRPSPSMDHDDFFG